MMADRTLGLSLHDKGFYTRGWQSAVSWCLALHERLWPFTFTVVHCALLVGQVLFTCWQGHGKRDNVPFSKANQGTEEKLK